MHLQRKMREMLSDYDRTNLKFLTGREGKGSGIEV